MATLLSSLASTFQAFLMGCIKNPISAVLRAGRGHICLGQDICGRNHTAAGTKITQAVSNRASYAECRSFAPTARASIKNKNKNKPWIQYQLCILIFSVYMCIQRMEKLLLFESMHHGSTMILLNVQNKICHVDICS